MEEFLNGLRRARAEYARKKTIGERFIVPREGEEGVDVLLYRPKINVKETLPVLFNLHGGAWIGGDAVLMESFCQKIADETPAMVVNVNYKKLDEKPFPYPQNELCDAVAYFAAHAEEYGVDPRRFVIGGHSAGAHIAAGAAILLRERRFPLAGQMLVYPVTDLTARADAEVDDLLVRLAPLFPPKDELAKPVYSPLRGKRDELRGLAPALIVLCGKDELRPQGEAYAKALIDAQAPVTVQPYPEALHGFLEVNRPDYDPNDPRRTPEQESMCRHCEGVIIRWLRAECLR